MVLSGSSKNTSPRATEASRNQAISTRATRWSSHTRREKKTLDSGKKGLIMGLDGRLKRGTPRQVTGAIPGEHQTGAAVRHDEPITTHPKPDQTSPTSLLRRTRRLQLYRTPRAAHLYPTVLYRQNAPKLNRACFFWLTLSGLGLALPLGLGQALGPGQGNGSLSYLPGRTSGGGGPGSPAAERGQTK